MPITTLQNVEPLWQYIQLRDYQTPATPVTHSAREGLTFFRNLFRRKSKSADSAFKEKESLDVIETCEMACIVPEPNLLEAARELETTLHQWLAHEKNDRRIVVLVTPPHCHHNEILLNLAKLLSWRVLAPPSSKQILDGDERWLTAQCQDNSSWVLPALESTYFRHAAGLTLIRNFINVLSTDTLSQGIIGCDSWAWAFISQLWTGRRPRTLTFQSFDRYRLTSLLQQASRSAGIEDRVFRQTDNGRNILQEDTDEKETESTSNFLQILAAHCRGNPTVAVEILRTSMRASPASSDPETQPHDQHVHQCNEIWIPPWDKLDLPRLYSDSGRDEQFVLQTLLLHNGLPLDLLNTLLPFSAKQVNQTIYKLEEAQLIYKHESIWKISRKGYPAVRRFLDTQGYLVDQF